MSTIGQTVLDNANPEAEQVLTAAAMEKVLVACLAGGNGDAPNEEEQEAILSNPDTVVVEAVRRYAFSKEKLAEHKEEIKKLLNELPDQFRQDTTIEGHGGGWSLMNAVVDKNGHLWGQQYQADALLALGLGVDEAGFCLPRMLWEALPGSMPYFYIKEAA